MMQLPRKRKKQLFQTLFCLIMLALSGCCAAHSTSATAKYLILVIGDGMQLEHERAASNYLFGTPDGALRHQQFSYRGAASTWDLTTYNRYAFSYGAPQITDSAFDPQDRSGYTPTLGYDPDQGGKRPYPLDSSGQTAYFGTRLKTNTTDRGAFPATDSAAAATALASGFKTDSGNIAWRSGAPDNSRLATIAEMYRNQRQAATGVVTTVPFSHATPAAFVSHNRSRDNYGAIAREIITSVRPEVVIGGGHPGYNDPAGISGSNAFQYIDAPEYARLKNSSEYVLAERSAGMDGGAALLAKADQAVGSDKKLFGLFGGTGGNFELHTPNNDGSARITRGSLENPTLADAARAAIRVLSHNRNGFFLLVEQGDIDWSNHINNYSSMIGGVWDLDNAVQAIESYIDQPGDDLTWNNTLVIVTADHGNSYMRLTKDLPKGKLPTQTPNGPGAPSDYDRSVAYFYDPTEVTYGFNRKGMNSHTNELVSLYARGAGSRLFNDFEGSWYPGTRILDNTQIFRVMIKALGLRDENRGKAGGSR
ncbi:MAG: alkaline phosphatase [Desulfuromonadales bacterium]|nr:alkaline phosphatase [Desulfuromonadales bacterium]